MNDRKKPEIRFKEFHDDWEQRKFDEVFMSLQNNTLSRAKLNDEAGAAQNIHYGDVLIKYDEVLDVSNEPLSYIEKQTIADKFKTSYLQNGDVIIADTAEDETVGKCTEIAGLTDQKVISGLHTMPVRPNRKFAPGFLGFYLNSAAYHDQLKPLMQGIKVTSISKGAVQDTVITFPSDLKEQKEIGAYFESLDRLITLHQRELDKLKIIKKSMLENCFPKNDESTPKFRFSGFTDDWEQRKVGDFLTLSKIPGHTGVDAKKLTVKLWGKGVVEKTDIFSGSENTQYYVRHAGQFMYGKLDFLHAAFGIVPANLDNYESTLDSPAFDLNGIDGQFLLERVTQEDFYLRNGMIANGSRKAKRIHEDTFLNMDFMVPSLNEQKQIGDFFRRLNNLITLHQRKLEKLNMLKKSLLKSMFA